MRSLSGPKTADPAETNQRGGQRQLGLGAGGLQLLSDLGSAGR